MDVRVIDHPLALARLTTLRDERTDDAGFRAALRDLTALLLYEATRDATSETFPIHTPLAETLGVPPGRTATAGAGAARRTRHGRPGACAVPEALVGFVGVARDEEPIRPSGIWSRCPTT